MPRQFTPTEDKIILRNVRRMGMKRIAQMLGRDPRTVRDRALHLAAMGAQPVTRDERFRGWTEKDLDELERRYPTEGAPILARDLRRSIDSVRRQANKLGLKHYTQTYGIGGGDRFKPKRVTEPTAAAPGSKAKFEVLRERALRGQELFHADDRADYEGMRGMDEELETTFR